MDKNKTSCGYFTCQSDGSLSKCVVLGQNKLKYGPSSLPLTANGSAVFSPSPVPRENSFGTGGRHLNRSHWKSGSASSGPGGGQGSKHIVTITNGRDPRRALKR